MYTSTHRRKKRNLKKAQAKEETSSIKYAKPKTKGQAEYIRVIAENDVVLCSGVAGTGKTFLAINLACQYLMEGKIEKIVVTRPIVAASVRNIGALPGNVREKIDPYLIPVMEEMVKYFGSRIKVEDMIRHGVIELAPLELMRGRTFDKTMMILDEAQNATYEQLKMFMTRIGEGSRLILNGDTDQTDLTKDGGGFDICIKKLEDIEGIGQVYLGTNDIVRNPIIKKILGALGS